MDGYRAGDRDDFDRLYRTTYSRLLRILYAITGDAAAAEDCVQESYVRAFAAWGRYRPDKPAEAWMHQIAVNTAISYRRRAKLRTVGEIIRRLGRPGHTADPAESAMRSDLIRALSALPPKVAADFVLRYHHGFTNREIARLEGVSERMIGMRLNRAREELARALGADWRGELPTSQGPGVVVSRESTGLRDA